MAGKDRQWMEQALREARKGLYRTWPNPAVGAVVVRGGRVAALGWHRAAGKSHAEALALKAAGKRARGATLYVTLEPCHHQGRTGPCTRAIAQAGIRRVVVATRDVNPKATGGIAWLKRQGIRVDLGLGGAEARELNKHFFFAHRHGRPWITLKIAASLDGMAAMADGRSQWITSAAARLDARRLRGQCDGIVVGGATVAQDNPSLLPQERRGKVPARFVLDWMGKVSGKEAVFHDSHATSTYWITSDPAPGRLKAVISQGANLVLLRPKRTLDESVLAFARFVGGLELRRLWVEGGPRLLGGFLGAGLAEELYYYQSPRIFGDKGTRSAFGGVGPPGPQGLALLKDWSVKKVGADLRWHGAL